MTADIKVRLCSSPLKVFLMPCQVNHVLPVILQIANDRSWRVRWSLANNLHEVLLNMQDGGTAAASLAGVFDGLLNDTEPEVNDLEWKCDVF